MVKRDSLVIGIVCGHEPVVPCDNVWSFPDPLSNRFVRGLVNLAISWRQLLEIRGQLAICRWFLVSRCLAEVPTIKHLSQGIDIDSRCLIKA